MSRFRKQGIQGLFQKSGSGRKPAFAPKSEEDAEVELQNIVSMSPDTISGHSMRWTLRQIKVAVPWLANISVPGVHHMLSRLGISYKRGSTYIHSPDVAYQEKCYTFLRRWNERNKTPTPMLLYMKMCLLFTGVPH